LKAGIFPPPVQSNKYFFQEKKDYIRYLLKNPKNKKKEIILFSFVVEMRGDGCCYIYGVINREFE